MGRDEESERRWTIRRLTTSFDGTGIWQVLIGNDDFDEEHDHVIDSGNDFGSDQYEGNYSYDD
ncbi:hypothetical protein V2J09_015493 [Rumex salicifolius]